MLRSYDCKRKQGTRRRHSPLPRTLRSFLTFLKFYFVKDGIWEWHILLSYCIRFALFNHLFYSKIVQYWVSIQLLPVRTATVLISFSCRSSLMQARKAIPGTRVLASSFSLSSLENCCSGLNLKRKSQVIFWNRVRISGSNCRRPECFDASVNSLVKLNCRRYLKCKLKEKQMKAICFEVLTFEPRPIAVKNCGNIYLFGYLVRWLIR